MEIREEKEINRIQFENEAKPSLFMDDMLLTHRKYWSKHKKSTRATQRIW